MSRTKDTSEDEHGAASPDSAASVKEQTLSLELRVGERNNAAKEKKKKGWARDRPITRSVGRRSGGDADASAEQEEAVSDVVNSVLEPDPMNYREAVRSKQKEAWIKAIAKELKALERNGLWRVVRLPKGAHALHGKRFLNGFFQDNVRTNILANQQSD
ncbi:hypothetical protein F442_07959 [Phytophthora nicotianae P10297]|uniref:Reverse transcriptase Ty1/copia-type domain-containing protein n=1 Tax=Phytophthora nicotianae P10297 TaxID=1317064 RepID=W2ZEZ9_PHYNI|nr:hypothetical protein F442_07959 [Phytophthora nicotianae P10297]